MLTIFQHQILGSKVKHDLAIVLQSRGLAEWGQVEEQENEQH